MKFKQELVSLVTVTFNDWNEYKAFTDWLWKESGIPFDTIGNPHVSINIIQIYVKLHDAPKIQRFVRKFKKTSIT